METRRYKVEKGVKNDEIIWVNERNRLLKH